jgi:uncharacterized protein YabE (DUF348 family)
MQIKLFLGLISFVYLVSTVVYAASEADYNGVYADVPLTSDLITTVGVTVDAIVGEFK